MIKIKAVVIGVRPSGWINYALVKLLPEGNMGLDFEIVMSTEAAEKLHYNQRLCITLEKA